MRFATEQVPLCDQIRTRLSCLYKVFYIVFTCNIRHSLCVLERIRLDPRLRGDDVFPRG